MARRTADFIRDPPFPSCLQSSLSSPETMTPNHTRQPEDPAASHRCCRPCGQTTGKLFGRQAPVLRNSPLQRGSSCLSPRRVPGETCFTRNPRRRIHPRIPNRKQTTHVSKGQESAGSFLGLAGVCLELAFLGLWRRGSQSGDPVNTGAECVPSWDTSVSGSPLPHAALPRGRAQCPPKGDPQSQGDPSHSL